MTSQWITAALLLCCFAPSSHSYKLLAFMPFPSNSHHNIFFSLIKVLADRGHHIHYYTSIEPPSSHPNVTLMLTPNFKSEFLRTMDIINWQDFTMVGVTDVLLRTPEIFEEQYYGNPVAQEIIKSSEKYDAVLMESYFMQEPVSALVHKFGCPAIEVSTLGDSAWINEWAGIPYNPAYQIDFKAELTDNLTFLEKVYNVYTIMATLGMSYFHLYKMQETTDKYFRYPGWEARPPLTKLLGNRSIILVNADPVLNYPYPTAPHVKNIAGLNLGPNKPLPKDLQNLMDESKKGVIYFSFGSNLNTSDMLRGKMGESFMNAFRNLPQKVLIKWETVNNDVKLPPNVVSGKWFPQRDILAHKNCVLFITHGGFLSLTETVYYGVPIIGIPFFSDQFKNALQAQTIGYGLMLKSENITTESVTWALNETINNPRYREKVKVRSQMLRSNRNTAQEEAIYWVEHAIKYPNSLTPRAAFMSFWEKRIYDVGTLLIIFVTTTLYVLTLLFFTFKKKSKPALIKKKVS